MILKVYEQQEAETEKPVFLRLIQDGGDVLLEARTQVGSPRSIVLRVLANGSIGRAGNVNSGLGFRLDAKARVVTK